MIASTLKNSLYLAHGQRWTHSIQRGEKKLRVQIVKEAISKWELNDIEITFLIGMII
jgi:hypothetical protein